MEKLSLNLFDDAALSKSILRRVLGGATPTGSGSTTASPGQASSAKITWSSDTVNDDDTTTKYGYCRKDDNGVVVAGCEPGLGA